MEQIPRHVQRVITTCSIYHMSIDTTKQPQSVYFPGNQKPNTANLTEKFKKR